MSNDPEWCDVCGGELGSPPSQWLEVGHALVIDSLNGQRRMARIVDMVEVYATRRLMFARLCPEDQEEKHFTELEIKGEQESQESLNAPGSDTNEFPAHAHTWRLLMLEESSERHGLEPDKLNEDIRELVHLPLGSFERGDGHQIEIYDPPPGVPLQDYLEALGRLLTPDEAAALTLKLMDAVERVHKANLYHFQVCPWTLHLSHRDPQNNQPPSASTPLEALRITFEGIRGFYDANVPVESHPVILGFSPPEFFGRAPGPLDHRADIFGAGMLFYYLLAGSPPPTGTLTGHIPYLPLRAFRFELAPGLQPFVDGCTAQDPSHRFKDIEEARESLHHCMDVMRSRTLSPDARRGRVSIFSAVDRHIGIGKGRRSPINQDGVFLGHDPVDELTLITVGDGVSTASYGSGDVASELLVRASSKAWLRRGELLETSTPGPEPTLPQIPSADQSTPSTEDIAAPESDDAQPKSDDTLGAALDMAMEETLDVDLRDQLLKAAERGELPEELLDHLREQETKEDISGSNLDEPNADDDPAIIPQDEDDDDHEGIGIDGVLEEIGPDVPHGRLSLVGPRTHGTSLQTAPGKFLNHILTKGNDAISAYINERFTPFSGPVHEVMGTTALTALIQGDQFTLSSLGDSRAYLLRDGHMECLTRDHNLATMRIIEGFSADECLALPQGTALARCLGTFEVREGELEPMASEPDMLTFRLLPGDVLLLTTDGLVDFAGPTEAAAERNIKAVLEAEEIPALACLRLILLANEGGGEDNIGVAVIRVTEHHPLHRVGQIQAFPPVDALRSPYKR